MPTQKNTFSTWDWLNCFSQSQCLWPEKRHSQANKNKIVSKSASHSQDTENNYSIITVKVSTQPIPTIFLFIWYQVRIYYVDPSKYFLIRFYANVLGQSMHLKFSMINVQTIFMVFFSLVLLIVILKEILFFIHTLQLCRIKYISKDFNSLPFSLRHITSFYSFKKAAFQFYFLQV